jgi:hypothetical protein
VTIQVEPDGRVACVAIIDLALASQSVWGQMGDFCRFASHDYFHRDIRIESGQPRQGARLHQFAFWRVRRRGRILWWREGEGFAFSDLSEAGPRTGFPHVLILRLESVAKTRSRLRVSVRGRWTARWIPLWARRLWLAWVFRYVVASINNDLLVYALARASTRRQPA